MRLDHLLSKETSGKANAFSSNVLRSVQSDKYFTLFNLEGIALKKCTKWANSSAGRAPALQAGGHRFDPGTLHQAIKNYELQIINA